MPYNLYWTIRTGCLVQTNRWWLRKAMHVGRNVPLRAHPTHEHPPLSIAIEDHQLMVLVIHQYHYQVVSGRDKHQHHNEFPLHTQPGRKVVYTECHRPGTMPLLCSPKGFMSSVLKPNLIFLASFANVGNVMSTFVHCDPSAGCLNILYCLRSSLCHRINLAFILFMNKRFRRGIKREIPHHFGRHPLLDTHHLNVAWIISRDLIPACVAYRA